MDDLEAAAEEDPAGEGEFQNQRDEILGEIAATAAVGGGGPMMVDADAGGQTQHGRVGNARADHGHLIAGRGERADLLRDLGLRLEAEVGVAERDRNEAGPGRGLPQLVELRAQAAALRRPVARRDQAAPELRAGDDEAPRRPARFILTFEEIHRL